MEHPVVLFDGVCNFCSATAKFLIRQDKKAVLRFASLQSELAENLLKGHGIDSKKFDSFILIYKGKIYTSSAAGLKLYNLLPWYWKWTQIFWLVPAFIRDAVYNLIARNRYRWFGKKDKCMIPSPEIRDRFL